MDFCNESFCDYDLDGWLSTQLEEQYKHLRASQWTTNIVLTVLLVAVFLVGSTGNILVLIVFAKNKTKQTATIFIMALATTDLTICLVVLPGVLIKEWYVPFRWDALCKGWELVRCATIPLSSLILVIVAVDRYILICRVGRFQAISSKEARWILLGIILCSIGLGIPPMLRVGVYQEGLSPGDPPAYLGLCISNDFLISKDAVAHYWQTMAAEFVLVLVTVIVLYCLIFQTVYRQGLWHPGASQSDAVSVTRNDAAKAQDETTNIAKVMTDGPNTEHHKVDNRLLDQLCKRPSHNGSPQSIREFQNSKNKIINISQTENREMFFQDSLGAPQTTLLVKEAASSKKSDLEPLHTSSTYQQMVTYSNTMLPTYGSDRDTALLNKAPVLQVYEGENTYQGISDFNTHNILSTNDPVQHLQIQTYSERHTLDSYTLEYDNSNQQPTQQDTLVEPYQTQQDTLVEPHQIKQDTLVEPYQIQQDTLVEPYQIQQDTLVEPYQIQRPNIENKLHPEIHKERLSNQSSITPERGQSITKFPNPFKCLCKNKVHPIPYQRTNAVKNLPPGKSSSTEVFKIKSGLQYHITDARQKRIWTAQVKTAKVLLMVTVVYVLSFAPVLLMTVNAIPSHSIPFYAYFLHSAANPLIYSFINPTFRVQLVQLLKCKHCTE